MKNLICILFAFTVSMTSLQAQWTQTSGPKGIRTNMIAKANGNFFAATQSKGIFRSTNNGTSWQAVNNTIGEVEIFDIVNLGNLIFAAVSNGCTGSFSIFKSSNNGDSWTSSGSGIPNLIPEHLAVKGDTLWAGVFTIMDEGIYRSVDTGRTWTVVPSIIHSPDEIFVSGNAIIVPEFNFIWKTTDNGMNWDLVEQFALSGVQSFAVCGPNIFGAGGILYTSTDNGSSWTHNPQSFGCVSVASSGNSLFVGSQSSVFLSTDFGNTFSSVSSGIGHGPINSLVTSGSTIFASTPNDSSGIYKSSNSGANWFTASNGLAPASTIRSLTSMGTTVFAGMQGDGIYRSTNDGAVWTKVGLNNDSLLDQIVFSMTVKNGAIYAAVQNGIYKSTDQGNTFTRIVHGFPGDQTMTAYSITSSNDNLIAAVSITDNFNSLDAIFYSSNSGADWHQSILPVDAVAVSTVACDGSSSVYAGVYGQSFMTTGLYKSTNSGSVFFSMTSSINSDIDFLAVRGNVVQAANLFGAFVSLDAGNSWFGTSIPCGGIFTYTFNSNFIFAGNCEGMFYSTSNGITWTGANNGFTGCVDVEASCTNNRYLFGGTYLNAVWKIPLSYFGITTIRRYGTEPWGINLFQNYPNPFNPKTMIRFKVPDKSSHVKLIVYDITGKEVNRVVNDVLNAGDYQREFDGNNLPSGIYFYTLFIDGVKSDTKEMILLK